MITMILLAVAAFFNALMDAVENENFFESIFKKWRQSFWYKRESWKYARKIFGYKIDAWHLFKSAMVLLIILSAVLYRPLIHPWVDVAICGIIWNGVFIFFYHKVFKIK